MEAYNEILYLWYISDWYSEWSISVQIYRSCTWSIMTLKIVKTQSQKIGQHWDSDHLDKDICTCTHDVIWRFLKSLFFSESLKLLEDKTSPLFVEIKDAQGYYANTRDSGNDTSWSHGTFDRLGKINWHFNPPPSRTHTPTPLKKEELPNAHIFNAGSAKKRDALTSCKKAGRLF